MQSYFRYFYRLLPRHPRDQAHDKKSPSTEHTMILLPTQSSPQLFVLSGIHASRCPSRVGNTSAPDEPSAYFAARRKDIEEWQPVPIELAMSLQIEQRMLPLQTPDSEFDGKRRQRTGLISSPVQRLEEDDSWKNVDQRILI
eukprot:GHVU01153154.1.p2 GENE.GHVU01153154.1~~GHVU01153154.1.p2  ORF type:complete len:142 (+),score=9.11 GHVU01153154.1:271-696(+)